MTASLPDLPYELDALEPYISRRTLQYHHGMHHCGYVSKLNALIENTSWRDKGPFEILISATNHQIFNNAAQAWNHTFFWHCLKPDTGPRDAPRLTVQVSANFGSHDAFRNEFISAAMSHFGSGWVWLVHDGTRLKITSTDNADTPFTRNEFPVLTVDLWEHAYYLDYQNRRDSYVTSVFEHLLNWEFAEQNFARCLRGSISSTDSEIQSTEAE